MQTNLNKLAVIGALVIFVLLPVPTRAETAVQAWVQRYNGPENSGAGATAMAVDGNNNVVVTGNSPGSDESSDYVTIKYSTAGMPLWTNRYDGPGSGDDEAIAVAVDASNNVIVMGISSSYGSGCAIIKYSSAGVPLWTNRYDGPGSHPVNPFVMAVDRSNNVIVAGYLYDIHSGNVLYGTIKYSSAGVPLWANFYNGNGSYRGDNKAYAVAVDGSNNVIVTGSSSGTGAGQDYATLKYSDAGVPLWTNRYDGNNGEAAVAVAVDRSNNVIVTGYPAIIEYSSDGVPLWTNYSAGGAITVDGSNNVIVTGLSSIFTSTNFVFDFVTIKYSSAGMPLWTNGYNGLIVSAWISAVAVDGSNNVIVAGYSYGSGGNEDYATIKYSSAGVPLWTNRYNGPGNGDDYAHAMAVDRSGNVIVAGSSWNGTNDDFLTIKYLCVRSPLVTGLQPTNGAFQLRVDDVLQPGTLVIEASTNLAGWAPVFTNTTPTNVLFYTDPDAGNNPRRFYRAFQFP